MLCPIRLRRSKGGDMGLWNGCVAPQHVMKQSKDTILLDVSATGGNEEKHRATRNPVQTFEPRRSSAPLPSPIARHTDGLILISPGISFPAALLLPFFTESWLLLKPLCACDRFTSCHVHLPIQPAPYHPHLTAVQPLVTTHIQPFFSSCPDIGTSASR